MANDMNGKPISVGAKVTVKSGTKTTEHVVKSINGDKVTLECCDDKTVSTVSADECTCCK